MRDQDALSTRIKPIKEELESLTLSAEERCIYKVHKQLREGNEEAYKPVLLAIGPYYYHDEVGQGFMKEHKLRYLRQMLERTNKSVETYMKALKHLEEQARKCYAECISQYSSDQFLEMMLLDGCFIIELFRKYKKKYKEDNPTISTEQQSPESQEQDPTHEGDSIISFDSPQSRKHKAQDSTDEHDPIFQLTWVLPRIARDLLLFENQLPFFVLDKLFGMSKSNGSINSGEFVVDIKEKDGINEESSTSTDLSMIRRQLSALALDFFNTYLPFKWDVDPSNDNSKEKIKDLVCLMHEAFIPSLPKMVWQRLKIEFRFKNVEFEHLLGLVHATISISILDTEINHARERQDQEAKVILKKAEIFKHPFGLISKAVSQLLAKRKDMSNQEPLLREGSEGDSEDNMEETDQDWERIDPNWLELKEAGVEFKVAKKFKDCVKEIKVWESIPHAFEHQEAGIKLNEANKFEGLLENYKDRNSRLYGELLSQVGVEFNKAKEFIRLLDLGQINIHSATELEEAGIKFKKSEKDNKFSIKFNNGQMEVSSLSIEDQTETCLRNLIAYEQYCDMDEDLNYVTNYVCFMDNLINSPKDVELFRRRGIIQNYLGDDVAISTMVNKLGHNINLSTGIYSRTSWKLNMHCKRAMNKWMANLWREYFNSPWAFISFLAAVLLLALTIVQTIFSIIP